MREQLILAASLAVGLSGDARADEKPIDYVKVAADARWYPPSEQLGLALCLARELDNYQVEVVRRIGDRGSVTVRITDGKKELHSWTAHLGTVFTESDGVLYYADFHPLSSGCAFVAFDLKAGKELWHAELKGLGPISHSKYRNGVRLEWVSPEAIAVYGKESAGRYVEIVDRKTGKTVGHKVFEEKE